MDCKIGIIGGSGFDRSDLLQDVHDVYAGTPWGDPSSPLQEGTVGGVPVVLLARHGRGHTLSRIEGGRVHMPAGHNSGRLLKGRDPAR